MSVMPSKFFISKRKLLCFPVLALAFSASSAWAQAPSIVVNAQQTLGTGYTNPQSIAVSSNGTVFIADTNNNRIIALDTYAPANGVNNVVLTSPFVLSTPQALALDAQGNLYVGDTPTNNGTGYGRIIELYGDGNGNLNGTVNPTPIVTGAPLTNPVSMTFDSSGTLFIGDYPPSETGAIYSLAQGSHTPQLLNITVPSPPFTPAALLRDSSNNLYFADNGNYSGSNGGIWVVSDTGGTATQVNTGQFLINKPSGLARDAAGDLYILSFLGPNNPIYNAGEQVLIVPAASPTTPYILPNGGLGTSSSMALDPYANMDVLDSQDGSVIQLSSTDPVFLGNVFLGKTGSNVLFNFEFNAPANLKGFQVVTQGDASSDVLESTSNGTCTNANHTHVGTGGPAITAYYPYTCNEFFYGNPAYPGVRSSAIQVKGAGGSILASQPVYQVGFAGVQITYPLTATTTATTLQQPQALAISGLDKKVYVADTEAGKVYSTGGLGSSALTAVSTGTIALSSPSALALDGAGNLFIADFDNADVIEVPTTTGLAPSVVKTGGLLQHPIALAFDFLGNLYIGDAGPGGINADSANPGYVVKLPIGGGAPFKMTIPSVSIVFPQALATDPYTASLLIGDGGNPGANQGQVVQVSSNGTTAGTGPVSGVTNPTGLAFDQAEDLYILDGTANTITAVPGYGSSTAPFLVAFNNTTLSAASALAISAGGQSFVIANIGAGSSNSLVYLNGNTSKLAFGSVKVGAQSQPQTATEYNIGNLVLTLQTPYISPSLTSTSIPFSLLASSTCASGEVLYPSASCTMNYEFKPDSNTTSSLVVTVYSDGYNTGVPTLTLSGTGTLGGAEKHKRRR